MNLTAPMQPKIATTENQVAIDMLKSRNKKLHTGLLGIFPAFRYAIAGNTKSSGVKPTAPHMATKSPKKGIAAAMRVITVI